MKQILAIIVFLLSSSLVLSACSIEGGNTEDSGSNVDKNNYQENGGNTNDSDEREDDDKDLNIGDTGLSDSNLGKAEITLDSVEVIHEDELDEDAEYAPLIAAHLTVKNIDDETFDPEKVLSSGLLIGPEEEYGSKWMHYEVSEEWTDTLDSNEETSGVIVFSHSEEEQYELIFGDKRSGASNSGSSNKTSFEFSNDEVN